MDVKIESGGLPPGKWLKDVQTHYRTLEQFFLVEGLVIRNWSSEDKTGVSNTANRSIEWNEQYKPTWGMCSQHWEKQGNTKS